MARKKNTQNRKRSAVLMVNVTHEEKKLFQGIARWNHTSFAEFARQLFYRESRVSKIA